MKTKTVLSAAIVVFLLASPVQARMGEAGEAREAGEAMGVQSAASSTQPQNQAGSALEPNGNSNASQNPSQNPTMIQKLRQNNNTLFNALKDRIKKFFGIRLTGTITSLSDSLIGIKDKNEKRWNVYISSNTLLKRRFGGKSAISEFSEGDEVAVVGQRSKTDDGEPSETDITAKNIRNLSIQRRNTAFIGDITAVSLSDSDNGSFAIQSKARGAQTVYQTANTVVTDKGVIISFSDLTEGDRVVVKGELWNRDSAKIDAQKIIRIPAKPEPSPTPAS